MLWLIKKLLWRRKPKPATATVAETAPAPKPRKPKSEWERALLVSLEQNNLAPSEEVILHAFDLFQADHYDPMMERRLVLSGLYAEIVADVASLQALVPDLIERAMARHPFEFTQIQQKEMH